MARRAPASPSRTRPERWRGRSASSNVRLRRLGSAALPRSSRPKARSASSSGCRLTLRGEAGAQAQETAAFVESLEALLDRPGRVVRRALHDGACGVRPFLEGTRGRARGGASARKLAGMDESRGVMPPKPGRPERRPSRGQIARRRALAAVLLFGSLGLALWLGVSAFGESGTEKEPPPSTTVAAPKQKILRIVFPEGFTRKEMVKRVTEVRQIAKTKRKVTPKLSGNTYATASKAAHDTGRLPQGREGKRGLSLPGDLRVHPEDDERRSWSRISSSSSTRTGPRSTSPTRRRRT